MWQTPLLLALTAITQDPGERVTFPTEDGHQIVADFYPVAGDTPTVICLPTFGQSRTSYEPLAASLNRAGIQMLSLDLRNQGPLFEMHQDVAAAVEFLARRGDDTTRLSLIGASAGASVGVDAVVRNASTFRSVVFLSPGLSYLGMETDQLQRWPGIPCLILAGGDESGLSDPTARAMSEQSETTTVFEVLQHRSIRGTRMFGQVAGIEDRITRFYQKTLLRPDLRIPMFPADDERVSTAGFVTQTLRVHKRVPAAGDGDLNQFTLMAFAVGDTLTLGAMTYQEFQGDVLWEIADTTVSFSFDTNVRGMVPVRIGGAKPEEIGQFGSFRGIHWVNVELPLPIPDENGILLRLRFQPGRGDTVAIPGGPAPFAAAFTDR